MKDSIVSQLYTILTQGRIHFNESTGVRTVGTATVYSYLYNEGIATYVRYVHACMTLVIFMKFLPLVIIIDVI